MTARKSMYIIVLGAASAAWQTWAFAAESDVTVVSASGPSAPAKPQQASSSDGTPVVHKSLHKKKKTSVASNSSSSSTSGTSVAKSTAASPASAKSTTASTTAATTSAGMHPSTTVQSFTTTQADPPPLTQSAPPSVVLTPAPTTFPGPTSVTLAPLPAPAPVAPPTVNVPASITGNAVPAVETGLPVGRYPGMGAPIRGVSTFMPNPLSTPPQVPPTGLSHSPLYAPAPASTLMSPPPSSVFASVNRSPSFDDSFLFNDYKKRVKNFYPWKTNIVTTIFWIGEGATPISSTTNVASAWDLDWRDSNSGSDSPGDRNGYASGSHASTVNPFYCALPFNDLKYPDVAREWLPRGWYRRPRDGKEVSACQGRWVEIKNAQGDVCYAQWEDVGPLNYSDAEYVFGSSRPVGLGDDHAGIDVSPAVADYLNVTDRNRYTSWRFVDEEDVRPGPWLKLDEQAVLFSALKQLKNKPLTPIQDASEPIDDSTSANKKKIDASRG